jgi:hypothetical protein
MIWLWHCWNTRIILQNLWLKWLEGHCHERSCSLTSFIVSKQSYLFIFIGESISSKSTMSLHSSIFYILFINFLMLYTSLANYRILSSFSSFSRWSLNLLFSNYSCLMALFMNWFLKYELSSLSWMTWFCNWAMLFL